MGSEMAQCIAPWKPNDLSFIPGNNIEVEGENQLNKHALTSEWMLKHIHAYTQ